MKFSRLCLEGIPSSGLVGIEGPNESGKSTIGEAILFAFFGRSRLSKNGPLDHLIRWGSDHLHVEVEFESATPEGTAAEYLIYREIDRFGTNYVKVLTLDDRREVAAGNIEVSDFVSQQLRADFFEFQHGFYHDQYDERLVKPSLNAFVERMIGVCQMRDAQRNLKNELEQLEREFSHYQKDIGRNLRHIEKYQGNVDRLPQLETDLGESTQEFQRRKDELETHKSRQENYRRLVGEREKLEGGLGDLPAFKGNRLAGRVGELLERCRELEAGLTEQGTAAAAECARGLEELRQGLQKVQALLRDYGDLRMSFCEAREAGEEELDSESTESQAYRARGASEEKSGLEDRVRRISRRSWWFLLVAVLSGAVSAYFALSTAGAGATFLAPALASGGVALVSLVWFAARRMVARGLRSGALVAAERLVREFSTGLEQTSSSVERLRKLESNQDSWDIAQYVAAARPLAKGTTARKLESFLELHGQILGESGEGLAERLRALGEGEKRSRKRYQAAVQEEQKKLKELDVAFRKAMSERDRLENEVRECQAQGVKKEALEEKNRELEESAQAIQTEIEDRRAAIQLLEETAVKISAKIGPTLGMLLRELLPHLTAGRYRDVKVGEDLALQVFSTERSDFLSATELSGGTNEALMLGLRLAFAHGLVVTRSRRPQFVFLDEPFKMMDVDRALAALRALREVSPELQQFFVIQPNYSEEQRGGFDRLIRTSLESSTLESQKSGVWSQT